MKKQGVGHATGKIILMGEHAVVTEIRPLPFLLKEQA